MSPRSLTERAGRGVLLQQRPFGQLAQSELAFAGSLRGGPQGGPAFRQGREKPAHGRALRAGAVLFALIQLRLAVQRGKQVRELAHGLGGAQEEHAARVQCVVEQRDELLLQVPAHIDQQVAATDQVEFGERRVFDHVLLGKDQHVADAFVDAVGAAVRLLGEKARQPFRRDVGGDAGGIEAGAGLWRWPGCRCRWRRPAP